MQSSVLCMKKSSFVLAFTSTLSWNEKHQHWPVQTPDCSFEPDLRPHAFIGINSLSQAAHSSGLSHGPLANLYINCSQYIKYLQRTAPFTNSVGTWQLLQQVLQQSTFDALNLMTVEWQTKNERWRFQLSVFSRTAKEVTAAVSALTYPDPVLSPDHPSLKPPLLWNIGCILHSRWSNHSPRAQNEPHPLSYHMVFGNSARHTCAPHGFLCFSRLGPRYVSPIDLHLRLHFQMSCQKNWTQ